MSLCLFSWQAVENASLRSERDQMERRAAAAAEELRETSDALIEANAVRNIHAEKHRWLCTGCHAMPSACLLHGK